MTNLDSRTRWIALLVPAGRPHDRPRRDDRRRCARRSRGSRLLRGVAGMGRERVPDHVRRVPPRRCRPLRSPQVVRRGSRSSRWHRQRAGSPRRRGCSSARAVQGLGAAVVSAVALSLMMTLFTEPAERAKAMGVFGFVAAGGGSIGVLLGGILTDVLNWHWIFLVNVPVGVAVGALAPADPGGSRAVGDAASRCRRRDHSHRVADDRRLRDRERQRGRLDVRADLGLLAVSGVLLAAFLVIEARVESPLMPLGLFRLRKRRGVECRRRPLGGRDVRVVLPFCPLSAARARVQPAPGRSRLPPGQPDHGRVLDRPVREDRVMRFGQAAARDGPRAGRDRPAALRACSGRRKRARRRASGHDPARSRRGDGVQPRAPRRHEDVKQEDAGLASGVVNTAFMMGGALGLAVLASLAASRTDTLRGRRRRHRSAHRRVPRGFPPRRCSQRGCHRRYCSDRALRRRWTHTGRSSSPRPRQRRWLRRRR